MPAAKLLDRGPQASKPLDTGGTVQNSEQRTTQNTEYRTQEGTSQNTEQHRTQNIEHRGPQARTTRQLCPGAFLWFFTKLRGGSLFAGSNECSLLNCSSARNCHD